MKKKSKIIIFLLFLIASCSQNFNISEFNKQTPKYKICLQDANHNIETSMNIKQDRIDMLQTNDSMIDLYNIENDMDEIKLSQKRAKMIDDCMKTK
tara:strand:- start:1077 stop:1364 length:288 start_codon:yes stop_codon:yes gene_type:complete